jgi:LPXTG-site transpeptidase (sortase) family protein
MAHRPRNKLLIVSRVLFLLGIVLLSGGVAISWNQYNTNKTADKTPRTIQTVSNGNPVVPPTTEKPKPSEFDSYTVAPDLPRYLFIPKISVKAMIKPMGVTSSNQIEAPRSAFDVGWYNQSAKPDHDGAMLIDGHVSGGPIPGIFYNLKNLMIGDIFSLERGDGKKFAYHVIKTQVYNANDVDMKAALSPINPDKPGLNLITCTGKVIKGSNNYSERLIVFTEQE